MRGRKTVFILCLLFLCGAVLLCLDARGNGKPRQSYLQKFENRWKEIEESYSKNLLEIAGSVKDSYEEIAALLVMRAGEVAHDNSAISAIRDELGDQAEADENPAGDARWVAETLWPRKLEYARAEIIRTGGKPEDAPKPAPKPKDKDLKDLVKRLAELQKNTASEFCKLADEAYRAGEIGKAYVTAKNVLDYDANYKKVRVALGYKAQKNIWLRAYDLKQVKRKLVWTEKWGWVPPRIKKRLENGQYPMGKKFLPKVMYFEAMKKSWKNAAVAETEHFRVESNAGIEAAVEAALCAEEHYEYYRGLFSSLFDLNRRKGIAGGFEPRQKKKYNIRFYWDKKSYLTLGKTFYEGDVPENMVGFYAENYDCLCLWRKELALGPGPNWRKVIKHECTHQFAYDHGRGNPKEFEQVNGWVPDALACFVEYLVILPDGSYRLPPLGPHDPMGKSIRKSDGGKIIPFKELVALGCEKIRDKMLKDREFSMRKIGQGVAMTFFFLTYENGRYRLAFYEFLRKAHYGTHGADTLAKTIGVNLNILEKQFEEWLNKL